MRVDSPTVVAIVGPTATGKSELALGVAEALDGEIVNADSMQLYRGLDVGTAKLPMAERRGIPHHLLDIWDLSYNANVAEYQALARASIADLQSAGKSAVLVGGSGLYVNAVLDDLDFPGTDPAIRQRLESDLESVGSEQMHARLAAADPDAAAAILPGNARRIVRALEVIEITGRPFTATLPTGRPYLQASVVGITRPRDELDRRISHRVDDMWERGLVAEVRVLADHGLREAPTASRALGYAQVLDYLTGSLTEDAAREATITATRRFARKQESWFKRDPRARWHDLGVAPVTTDLVERVVNSILPDTQ